MKKLALTVAAAVLMPCAASASISLLFSGGLLYGKDSSSPLADGSLIFAVVSLDNNFEGPDIGLFAKGDDTVIGKWFSDSSTAGEPGGFDAALTGLNLSSSIVPGSQIALYWFPTLRADASESDIVAGLQYGFYTDPSWVIPADGSTSSFGLESEAVGGTIPNSALVASRVIPGGDVNIPEPSAFAAVAGLAVLGVVASRRRRSS